jgi:hypothetical protein
MYIGAQRYALVGGGLLELVADVGHETLLESTASPTRGAQCFQRIGGLALHGALRAAERPSGLGDTQVVVVAEDDTRASSGRSTRRHDR